MTEERNAAGEGSDELCWRCEKTHAAHARDGDLYRCPIWTRGEELSAFFSPRFPRDPRFPAYRRFREAEYGGKLPDILFGAGHGKWTHEPYQTGELVKFRAFVAGWDAALSEPLEPFYTPTRRDGQPPCGECRLNPGETCDICGAKVSPPLVLGLSSSSAKVAAAGATRCAAGETACQSEGGPRVYHYGAALHGIADEHADVLTPRQRKALYEAGNLLWDSPAAEPSLQITGDQ